MKVRRTEYLSKQGPRNRPRRAAGAGLRHAMRHWEDDIPSRGRGTGFAGPQAPGCETQPFCVPSKPALQVRSRGTQPPRGAGSDTQCATVGA